MTAARQRIRILDFRTGRLVEDLKLDGPSYVLFNEPQLRQLRSIESYVASLGCGSLLEERHYIDRDYMEDHSVFYSRSLHPYTNYCTRVHFFTCKSNEVRGELKRLVKEGLESGLEAFRRECRAFSERCYLGFTILKPLSGSPVGRTVLTFPGRGLSQGGPAMLDCCRNYPVHVQGVELTVRGLAFQQQDTGVSACATTALWSSLQKVREFEELLPATPAQITLLASRYTLPHGRALPSEGLSIDQMCQAVQASGVSPYLVAIEDYGWGLAMIHSSVASGMAPVLVIESPKDGGRHAVTLTGLSTDEAALDRYLLDSRGLLVDKAGSVQKLYIHDDRLGPYREALLRRRRVRNGGSLPLLKIKISDAGRGVYEDWIVTHVLVPIHGKVRLSFAVLAQISIDLGIEVMRTVAQALFQSGAKSAGPREVVAINRFIARPQAYVEGLFGARKQGQSAISSLLRSLALPRYLGIVRLSGATFGTLDVLFDSTSTEKNINPLVLVAEKNGGGNVKSVVSALSARLECPQIWQ